MADPRLHLLHLSSPTLPIGAYAYSQGLEYAIEAGWLDGDGLRSWLRDSLHLGVATLDLPILGRAHASSRRRAPEELDAWNDLLLACRETYELLLEDQQVGAALWRLLASLGVAELPALRQAPGYAVAFAVACAHWGIDRDTACSAYCFSWLENQVTAATKLVPLGQSAAQALLVDLLDEVDEACTAARAVRDEAIGLSCPGLALASCRHEHQHTRLFRS
jgi:urease accessory protein